MRSWRVLVLMSNVVCADILSMTVLVGTGNGSRPADEPREIVTAADVEAVLAAPKASFDELVLCVKAARSAQRPDLRHAAAERAFDTAVLSRSRTPVASSMRH